MKAESNEEKTVSELKQNYWSRCILVVFNIASSLTFAVT